MNDSSENYLLDFYGSSSSWFAIYVLVTSVLIIITNIFFICITITSKPLLSKSSNWFLIGFAAADLLQGLGHLYDAYAIGFGSISNREPCRIAGMLVLISAPISWGFPGLIAADRYYKIKIAEYGKISIGKALFTVSYFGD